MSPTVIQKQEKRQSPPFILWLRLTAILVFLLTIQQPLLLDAQEIPTGLPPGIDLELPPAPGPGPAFLPRHSSPGFLKALRSMASKDPATAGELLLAWIRQREGRLVFDGSRQDSQEPDFQPVQTIPPPEVQLHDWAKTLPEGFLRQAFQNMDGLPLNGTHPWIWAPHLETEARIALETAVECGDRKSASILSRRPGLITRIPPEWRSWIFESAERPTLFRSTGDTRIMDNSIGQLSDPEIWNVHSWELQIPPTIADPRPGKSDASQLPRRSSLARVHGLIKDDILVLAEDRKIRAYEKSGNTLWEWSPSTREYKGDPHPPGTGTRVPITSGSQALFLLRSPRLYQPPNTNLAVEAESEKYLGWIEGHILDLEQVHKKPQSTWKLPIVEEGFSISPTPLWVGNSLFVIATKGVQDVETWLFSFDTDKRTELWRRKLETRRIEKFSIQDLRQVILTSHVTLHENILSIDRSPGRIDRVCSQTGEHISVVIPPIYPISDLPSSLQIRWGNRRLQHFPRPRPPAFPVTVTIDSKKMHLCIPDGSRHLLATNLENGSLLWSLPVSRWESILGSRDGNGNIWVLDSSVPAGGNSIGVRQVTLEGEALANSHRRIELGAAPATLLPADPTQEATIPYLLSDPVYAAGKLWISTLNGIKTASLDENASTSLLPWPADSLGGWIFPWSEDGKCWGVIHRGESLRGTSSRLEVWTLR
ncbi:MAG: hypothetical protein ACPG1Z_09045 [Planctomycetota bacterium]